ncbi:Molybdopterin molybdenumtransferase [Brevundimonas sp. NIBR10]|uniref:molybdopterin molybdotransferase MoeA n=1 Tax=Brevundimonas sp. NIBR10 TaxID=3015997 RepID=UPI0022F1CA8A|nr:gephyrin-like molybdotransferase Glp [Brevundimonas sp. NIBR10]WGM48909.1 Molybdopterin molybdenumtransferase [Brevundimonas sp. NIBR10]
MKLPTVEAALEAVLAQVGSLGAEDVALAQADGRWLAAPIAAGRDQPPFDASAMDGWAVRDADVQDGASLRIVGESVAGRGMAHGVEAGETARIFTGAPVPPGADRVVIQEEVERRGDLAAFKPTGNVGRNIRRRGCDFREGEVLLKAGTRVNPWRLALAASAGVATLRCGRRPTVAILATGDELVEPGQAAGPDQIYNSGAPSLAAFVARHGGGAQVLASSGDDKDAIAAAVSGATFDVLVTIGGASVGDHDLVKPALRDLGAVLHVEGVAMRPGKPVWFATLPDGRAVLGLPGNPASALVCAELFLAPVLARLQGGALGERFETAILAGTLPANGPRDHYIRAVAAPGPDGVRRVTPFADQDSSLVSVMAAANALIRRLPFAEAVADGETVSVMGPSI